MTTPSSATSIGSSASATGIGKRFTLGLLRTTPQLADFLQPTFPVTRIRLLDRADQRGTHWRNAGDGENAALQTLEAVCAKVIAVNRCRHSHGDDDPGAATFEQLAQPASFTADVECVTVTEGLFE